jgi:hypothetical protein
MTHPRITDNDSDMITASLNGVAHHLWFYDTEAERRLSMKLARAFQDGWIAAKDRAEAHITALEAQVAAADAMAKELAIIIQDWDGEQEDMIDAADALAAYNAMVNASAYRATKEGKV